MKTWKQSTFFGFLAILALAFTLAACKGNGNGNGGSGQGLTVRNLPDIEYIGVRVLTGVSPTNEGEFKAMGNKTILNGPPWSPVSLMAVGAVTFTESGTFLVEVEVNNHSIGMSTTSKYTVTNFSNGSATVDWNTMTEYED